MRLILIAVCAIAVTSVPSAWAQNKVAAEDRGAAPANLTVGPQPGPPLAQFVFEADAKEKTGTASFGWKAGEEQFQLSVSGPIGSTSTSEPLSLSGLAPGASAKLTWLRLYKRGPSGADLRQIRRMCEPVQARKRDLAFQEKSRDASLPAPPPELEMYPCFSTDFTGDEVLEFDEYQHLYDPAWLLSLDGRTSRTKFDYVDADWEAHEPSHASGGFTIRAGRVDPARATIYAAYEWLTSYKAAGDPQTICSPIDGTTRTGCKDVVRGEPTKITRSMLSLEVRRFFGPRMAASPYIRHDFRNAKATEVGVPVYFMGPDTPGSGGIRFSYRTDKKELLAVVFIGASMKLLP